MKILQNIDDLPQILIIDALRHSFLSEKRTYKALWRKLRIIERHSNKKSLTDIHVLDAIRLAWDIIDTIHRMSGLIGKVRGLKQNTPEYKNFLNSIKRVEEFRHCYQHLDSEVTNRNSKLNQRKGEMNPIMGVISWTTANKDVSFTTWLGTGDKRISAPGMIFDTQEDKFVSNVIFSAFKSTIDLENLHKNAEKMDNYINKWLEIQNYLGQKKSGPNQMKFIIQRT